MPSSLPGPNDIAPSVLGSPILESSFPYFIGLIVLGVTLSVLLTMPLKSQRRKRRSRHSPETMRHGLNHQSRTEPNYEAVSSLLSVPQRTLLQRLSKACPPRSVYSQVAISRVIRCAHSHDKYRDLPRIGMMSLDFVICPDGAEPLAVVELDDASHDQRDRQPADARRNEALASAGIPIFRYAVRRMPTVTQLARDLKPLFDKADIPFAEPEPPSGQPRYIPATDTRTFRVADWMTECNRVTNESRSSQEARSVLHKLLASVPPERQKDAKDIAERYTTNARTKEISRESVGEPSQQ